jgi:hypothetical protein
LLIKDFQLYSHCILFSRMNFNEQLDKLPLPIQGSNRGYAPHQLIKQFMASVWYGANKFEHCEDARQDEVMRQCWGFGKMAGCRSFHPFVSMPFLIRVILSKLQLSIKKQTYEIEIWS